MPIPNFELLKIAIERNVALICGLPSAGLVKELKSRFLIIKDESILVEGFPNQAAAVDELIKSEEPATILFRSGVQNVEFRTRILQRYQAYPLNATTRIEALRLELPTSIKTVQRRSDYRAPIPPDTDVTFACHRIGEQDDLLALPQPTQQLKIVPRDMSTTGLGAIWYRRKEDPHTLANNQRVRLMIKTADGEILIDGRVCHASRLHEPELVRVGVRFQMNLANIPDRHKQIALQKLMTTLQRQQLKRGGRAR